MLLCNLLPTVALRLLPSIKFVASPSPSYSSPVACISLHFYKLNLILLFSACISQSCFILHFLITTCVSQFITICKCSECEFILQSSYLLIKVLNKYWPCYWTLWLCTCFFTSVLHFPASQSLCIALSGYTLPFQ